MFKYPIEFLNTEDGLYYTNDVLHNVIINGKIIYKPNYNLKKGDVIQFTNLFIKKLQFNKFFKKNNKNNWKRWKRKKLWWRN